jgi:hypothetical protein
MSVSREPYSLGQKVHLLTGTGLQSGRRYEVTKVWQYPTTFRYLLDTGYVADHSELRAADDDMATLKPAEPPPLEPR